MSGLSIDQAALIRAGMPAATGAMSRLALVMNLPQAQRGGGSAAAQASPVAASRLDMIMALPQAQPRPFFLQPRQVSNPLTRDVMVRHLERNQGHLETRGWLDSLRLRAAGDRNFNYGPGGQQLGGLGGFSGVG